MYWPLHMLSTHKNFGLVNAVVRVRMCTSYEVFQARYFLMLLNIIGPMFFWFYYVKKQPWGVFFTTGAVVRDLTRSFYRSYTIFYRSYTIFYRSNVKPLMFTKNQRFPRKLSSWSQFAVNFLEIILTPTHPFMVLKRKVGVRMIAHKAPQAGDTGWDTHTHTWKV